MVRLVAVEDEEPIILDTRSARLTDEQFSRLCADNPELRLELTAERQLVIMSPTGAKTGWRNHRLAVRLGNWAERDGTGVLFRTERSDLRTLAGSSASGGRRSARNSRRISLRSVRISSSSCARRGIGCPRFSRRWRNRSRMGPGSAGTPIPRRDAPSCTVRDGPLNDSRTRRALAGKRRFPGLNSPFPRSGRASSRSFRRLSYPSRASIGSIGGRKSRTE